MLKMSSNERNIAALIFALHSGGLKAAAGLLPLSIANMGKLHVMLRVSVGVCHNTAHRTTAWMGM